MISIIITKESIVAKYRRLGVKEPEKEPEWAADQQFRPFPLREYGSPYKTVARGATKRAK